MAQTSSTEMNQFVRVVDDFMQKYARLQLPVTRAEVYASGDAALIADYHSALNRGALLKTNIETVTGAWSAAKKYYLSLTNKTSMIIGDAIDEIRSWFGYNPGMGGLGAIQIPAAIWITGTIAAALLLNNFMNKIFVSVEASKLQRENPGMPRDVAVAKARDATSAGGFLDPLKLPIFIGLAGLLYMVLK